MGNATRDVRLCGECNHWRLTVTVWAFDAPSNVAAWCSACCPAYTTRWLQRPSILSCFPPLQGLTTCPVLSHLHILPARRLLLAVPPRARHLPIVDRRAHLNEQR